MTERRVMLGLASLAAASLTHRLHSAPEIEATERDPTADAKLRALHAAERAQWQREQKEAAERAAFHRKWGASRYLPHQGAKERARRAKKERGNG